MWCIPKVTDEFIQCMEDVLNLYALPYNPEEPVLCFDEKSKQLLREVRTPLCLKPGKPCRRDYEYQRNGTRNIFLTIEPKGGFRQATVTRQRKKPDFAREIDRVVTLPRYRTARRIHLVMDSLNTHHERSFLMTFGARKTRRMMRRITFHYTPKHASWLNMAEIELSILGRQCLNRRIPTEESLTRHTHAWEQRRNGQGATITWKFTVKDARKVFKYTRQN